MKAMGEKSIVVVLFILVLIAFSLAEKDSQKIEPLYKKSETYKPVKHEGNQAVEQITFIKNPR